MKVSCPAQRFTYQQNFFNEKPFSICTFLSQIWPFLQEKGKKNINDYVDYKRVYESTFNRKTAKKYTDTKVATKEINPFYVAIFAFCGISLILFIGIFY